MTMKTFANRSLKMNYILVGATTLFIITMNVFFQTSLWQAMLVIIPISVLQLLFVPQKYVISANNTFESYNTFGRMKSRSIPISGIVEMKKRSRNQLVIWYSSENRNDYSHLVFELSDTDIREIGDELLKINPDIKAS